MRLRSSAHRRGVSLLEVLGATAIFLMSIVAIGELMSVSTDQALEVQFRSRATRLCQSKLNEFTAGVELVNGATSGEFEEEPDWTWQAEVTSETTAVNLYRVRVTVSRETTRGPVEVSMTQFVFDPQQRGQLTAGTPAGSTTDPAASGDMSGNTGSSGGASGMSGGAGGASGMGGGGMGGGNRPGGGAMGFGGGVPGGGGRPPGGGGGFGGGRPPGGGMGFGGGVPGGGGGRPPGGGGGFGGGNRPGGGGGNTGFGGGPRR